MTPEQEDALVKETYAKWDGGGIDGRKTTDTLVRLAIRAAYAQGVKDAEERRDDRIDCLMRDMERD